MINQIIQDFEGSSVRKKNSTVVKNPLREDLTNSSCFQMQQTAVSSKTSGKPTVH